MRHFTTSSLEGDVVAYERAGVVSLGGVAARAEGWEGA